MAFWVSTPEHEIVLGDPQLTPGMKRRCDELGPGSYITDTETGATVYTAKDES